MVDPFQELLTAWVEALVRGGVGGALVGGAIGLAVSGAWLWRGRARWAGLGRPGRVSVGIAALGSGGWFGAVIGAWLTGMAATSAAWDAHQPSVRYLAEGAADGLGALGVVGGADFDLTGWVRGEVVVGRDALADGVRRAVVELPKDRPEALREALLEQAGRTAQPDEMMRIAVASGALLGWSHQGRVSAHRWLAGAPERVGRGELAAHLATEVIDALHDHIRRYVSLIAWALALLGALPGAGWLAWQGRRVRRRVEGGASLSGLSNRTPSD